MPSLRQSPLYPLLLLLVTGSMLAASVPFAKVAANGGIPMLAFAFWQYLGGGLLLLLLAVFRHTRPPLNATYLRFYAISGFVSLALPNVMIFLAIAQIGAGLPSIAYAFPPMFTYFFALILRMEKFVALRALGILLGLVGILMILLPRTGHADTANLPWLILAMIAPILLALGNIYRTRYWPKDAAPLALAPGMLLAASVWLLIASIAGATFYWPRFTSAADWSLPSAMLFACLAFLPYFELQRVAGPVYLSQIGYVMSAIGLLIGFTLFGERYPLLVWAAIAVIAVGIVLVNRRNGAD